METDPMMTQHSRTDFPEEVERQVIDGRVLDGKPEAGDLGGLLWLLVLVLGFAIIVGLVLNWGRLFP